MNRSVSLAMSTSGLEAWPGKLDIKRHSIPYCILFRPCLLYSCLALFIVFFLGLVYCILVWPCLLYSCFALSIVFLFGLVYSILV